MDFCGLACSSFPLHRASDAIRGASLLFGIGSSALPLWISSMTLRRSTLMRVIAAERSTTQTSSPYAIAPND